MVKHKFFVVDIKKEEEWINEQIKKGYRLVGIQGGIGRYKFKKQEDQNSDYSVRIDFRVFENRAEYLDYITLFEDCGWRHIKGNSSSGTQYFEKIRSDADNEIFSDGISKAERYKRISMYWLDAAFVSIVSVFVQVQAGGIDLDKMLHPKQLYYTPGLWELSGLRFWMAFLFETPFALGRGFIGVLSLVLLLIYGYWMIKALYWYRIEKREAVSQ